MKVPSAQTIKLLCILAMVLLGGLWLLLGVELPGDSRIVYETQNAGHVLLFSIITFFLIFGLHRFRFKSSLFLAIVCGLMLAFLFGAGTEYIQPKFGRDSSWDDLFKDVQGIAAGLFFYFAFIFSKWKRYLFSIVAIAIVFYGLSTVFALSYAKHKRDANFPMLGDFESAIESRFFEKTYSGVFDLVAAPPEWSSNHSIVARLDYYPGSWPGVRAFDLRGNWGQYQYFKFQMFNPHSESVQVVLRIHDLKHNNEHDDRFNQTFTVEPGEREISVPISKIENTRSGRKLDMQKIRVMMLYMAKPNTTYTLYFDNFRLE